MDRYPIADGSRNPATTASVDGVCVPVRVSPTTAGQAGMEPGGATGGATLKDLRSEDKLKIGNLLRELARAQREGQQATRERSQIAARLQAMRSQNDLIVQACALAASAHRV